MDKKDMEKRSVEFMKKNEMEPVKRSIEETIPTTRDSKL
jgi:hypothetical protein